MPSTLNGVGTRYYGKKNVHARDDDCEHCGVYNELKSFDTTIYFVVLFIPLVPLGKKRIVDLCSSCKRHYAIDLKDWEQQRKDSIQEVAAAFESDRHSVDKALELLKTTASFIDKDSFLRYAADIENAVSGDPDGLGLIGWAYEYFDEPARAEETYRKALLVKDDETLRASLGILLLRDGRPREAKDFLRHDVGTLYYLVEGFQAEGSHLEAKRVLDEMIGVFPELGEDALFEKYQKRVQKRLGGDKRVVSELLSRGGGGLKSDTSGSSASLVSAAVIIAVLLGVGFTVFNRTQRADIYLVSGLERPYAVTIGDTSHQLAPGAPVRVTIPRRDGITARVVEDGWTETIEIPLPTAFSASLFDGRTYVLNPDQVAVIVWEQMEYAVNSVEKDRPYRIHLGRGFYTFEGLDYVFEEFPETIELSSTSSVARRDRITRYAGLSPLEAYSAAFDFVTPADRLSYLTHALRADPDDMLTLGAVAGMLEPDAFAELASPELTKHPQRMEWHRIYQSAMDIAGRSETLVEEYRERLAADPTNNELKYLLARVTPELDASQEMMGASVQGASPSAYGFHGLAYQELIEGRFEEAYRLAMSAREIDPDNNLFAYVEEHALLALRRYAPLLERREATLEENPLDGDAAADVIQLAIASGDRARAKAVIENTIAELSEEDSDAVWEPYLEAVYHLGTGDFEAFRERSALVEGARFQFQRELSSGAYPSAIEALTASGEQTGEDHLLVYLAAARARDRAFAETQLELAVALLSAGGREERKLAQCLLGNESPSAALRLALEPATKVVGLAVIAQRFGDARARRLARKLNYELHFDRHYLDTVFQ